MKQLVLSLTWFLLPLAASAEDCPSAARELKLGTQLSDGSAEERAHYEAALRACPSLIEAHYNLALLQLRAGEFAAAEKNFLTAKKTRPDEQITLGLAEALLGQDRLREAEAEYRALLAADPANPRAHQGLGAVFLREEKLAQAEEILRAGLQYSPASAELYLNLGAVLERAGRTDEAKTSYETAAARQPDSAAVQLALGRMALAEADLTEAQKRFQRALALAGSSAAASAASVHLATVEYRQGDAAAAEKRLRAVLATDALNKFAREALDKLLKLEGKVKD